MRPVFFRNVQHLAFGYCQQVVRIHHDDILFSEESECASLQRAARNFGLCYRLKSFLGKGQGWRIGGESYWPGDDTPGYLFCSTSVRNKPYFSLNTSHV